MALFLGIVMIVMFCGYIAWRYLGQGMSAAESEQFTDEIMSHQADVVIFQASHSSDAPPSQSGK